MKPIETIFRAVTRLFVKDSERTDNNAVRVRYGLFAGWMSIAVIASLFSVKMFLGLKAGSISVVANAFHLLSHLANSVILVLTFYITAKPATAKNPFGHGRMEHVAPLVMSIFLFVSGIQIAERSLEQALHPKEVHFFGALIWILLISVFVNQLLSYFVRYLGKRVSSHAILSNARHHTIEGGVSIAVIAGLIAGHYYHRPELDGIIGIFVSLWLFYLGYHHARKAVVPLLGQAPTPETITKIREISKSVDEVFDVHEIIVHDYGSLTMISLHVEIPVKAGPEGIHEITEKCERELRKVFGGEVICHSDPLLEKTPETQAIEDEFQKIISENPEALRYHDFRVVAESNHRHILVADIDMDPDIPESKYKSVLNKIKIDVNKRIKKIAYCSLYITPKYAY